MSEKGRHRTHRVLFVDDEPKLLQAIHRTLRGMRHEWEMAFADSGQKALGMMKEKPFQVVVTDIRMPEMDGVALLTETMKHYPKTIRVALSGQADKDLMARSTRVAHQFLSKPCKVEMLKSTISNGCSLSSMIGRIDSLPSLPALYTELVDELNSSDGSIKKVGEIISKDLAMTAKILHLSNSAFFGFRTQISSPSKAAVLLGMDTVKTLVLSLQVFSQFKLNKKLTAFIEHLQGHSVRTGILAKNIAKEADQDRVTIDHAFMAGTLHDLGKLIFAAKFPDQYQVIIDKVKNENSPFSECERATFGVTHSEMGAYLTGLWGLPAAIVEAIAFHHNPSKCVFQQFSPLTAAHLADVMVHQKSDTDGERCSGQFDGDYLSTLNLTDKLPEWQKSCEACV
jgi:HD-like signal output (HDOD) protein